MLLKNINPNKLHDELINAGILPISVTHNRVDGEQIAENTEIKLAEGADMALVQAIIDTHDPAPLPQPKTDIEILQEENTLLKLRLYDAEQVASDNSQAQQELLEILLEMGVI